MTIKPPAITWTVSIGNLIPIVMLIIGGSLAYGDLRTQQNQNVQYIADLRGQATENRRSINVLDVARARDDERFTNILQFMARIDTRLDRIENRDMP
jgi:menaquinone-dependent protoporphyrinogen IX oxidase